MCLKWLPQLHICRSQPSFASVQTLSAVKIIPFSAGKLKIWFRNKKQHWNNFTSVHTKRLYSKVWLRPTTKNIIESSWSVSANCEFSSTDLRQWIGKFLNRHLYGLYDPLGVFLVPGTPQAQGNTATARGINAKLYLWRDDGWMALQCFA